MKTAAFRRGDRVEVASEEEGFHGSYFEGNVVEVLGSNQYKVEYVNLVKTEDESELLIETVSGEFIRPFPPRIRFGCGGFGPMEAVDAWDNDAWWVGRVTGKKGMMYHVYFDYTGDEIAYPVSKLRPHLDWSNGRWVSPDRRKKRGRDSSPARNAFS
ncbi:unnamed protein product [Linum tenue]|uniref:Agenet domain-containing protein n=1 Tax=Linum tenue TaxID=586396 RepID=A0AAV0MX82_9ROSI|nr:unnamed protein product [Linum tenue]